MDIMIAGVFQQLHLQAGFARTDYPQTLFAAECEHAADVMSRAICHSQDLYVRESHHPSSIREFVC